MDVLLHVDLGLASTDGEESVLPDLADAPEHDHPDEAEHDERDQPTAASFQKLLSTTPVTFTP